MYGLRASLFTHVLHTTEVIFSTTYLPGFRERVCVSDVSAVSAILFYSRIFTPTTNRYHSHDLYVR